MSLATIAAICIGDFKEAVGVMLFYRIGELFEEIAVERSRSQIMEAVDLRPEVVTKVHGDHSHVIPAEDAKIGDLLLIRPGDRIPLDGTVVDGESRIDTSPVTGGTNSGQRPPNEFCHLRLHQYLRRAEDPRGEDAGRIHGDKNPGFRGKRSRQQAAD